MIQFLEIYGNENFGESAQIDWPRVWEYCSECDILDFNYEVEDLVYNTKDEEFRDKVFAFVEASHSSLFNLSKNKLLKVIHFGVYLKCQNGFMINVRPIL